MIVVEQVNPVEGGQSNRVGGALPPSSPFARKYFKKFATKLLQIKHIFQPQLATHHVETVVIASSTTCASASKTLVESNANTQPTAVHQKKSDSTVDLVVRVTPKA